jgi:hypothetical protein
VAVHEVERKSGDCREEGQVCWREDVRLLNWMCRRVRPRFGEDLLFVCELRVFIVNCGLICAIKALLFTGFANL